jgi:hypothetical protein
MGMCYQRGSTWWIQYYVHGKRVRESTHSTNPADASRLLNLRKGTAAAGKPVGPNVERTTFGELATMLLNDYRADEKRSGAGSKMRWDISRVSLAASESRLTMDGSRALPAATVRSR